MRRCHVTLGLSRHGFNKNNDFNCDCRYWLFTLADWSTQNAKFRSWKGVPAGAGYFADPTLALDTCPNLISTIQSTCRRYPRISGTFSSLNSFRVFNLLCLLLDILAWVGNRGKHVDFGARGCDGVQPSPSG